MLEKYIPVRLARLASVQVFFSIDNKYSKVDTIINDIKNTRYLDYIEDDECEIVDSIDLDFFGKLTKSADRFIYNNDEKITGSLIHKNIERVNKIVLNIIRVAAHEYNILKTPKKIILNEYIEIGKSFFGKSKEVSFINAILNKIIESTNEDK